MVCQIETKFSYEERRALVLTWCTFFPDAPDHFSVRVLFNAFERCGSSLERGASRRCSQFCTWAGWIEAHAPCLLACCGSWRQQWGASKRPSDSEASQIEPWPRYGRGLLAGAFRFPQYSYSKNCFGFKFQKQHYASCSATDENWLSDLQG